MRTLHVATLILALCGGLWAQAPAESPAPATEEAPVGASDAAPAGETAPPEAAAPAEAPIAGDTVTLKSGAVLRGVQVVRQTPMGYEILAAGEVKFTVPRKLVESVEYDDVESGAGAGPGEKSAEDGNLIQGNKVDPELWQKLDNAFGEPVQEFDNQDLVNVIGELSKRAEVPVTVDDLVKGLPAEKRSWTLKTTPETTLRNLLQQDLPKSFPEMKVVYEYDKIRITLKEPPADAPNE